MTQHDLLLEINAVATEFDQYEYGLPVYNTDSVKKMVSHIDRYSKELLIKEFEKFITHPGKPGHKRSDVVEYLKKLKNE